MPEINWGMAQMPDFGGNALAAFEQGRQIARQRKTEEAWGAYAANPDDPNALNALAQYDPKSAIALRQDAEKRRREMMTQDLQRKAVAGDPAALAQLSGIDLDAWSKIDTRQKAALKERFDYIGNAGLGIARLPPEQRAAAWDAAIDQGVQQFPELAQYRGKYSEQALKAEIAKAGMMSKLIEVTSPQTVNLQAGAGFYERDPATGTVKEVIRPNTGGATPFTPVEGGPKPGAVVGGYRFKGGNPNDRSSWEPATGGASGNAGGNFRPVGNAGGIAQSLFPGVRVTQVRRDPNSSLGRANPNSWHNKSGGAVDVAPIPGMTFDQYVQQYRNAGYNIIEARDEVKNPSRHATGPHWHIVLGERN